MRTVAEVADAWVPAFLAGRRAPDDVYARDVVVWHNIGEREEPLVAPPSYGRLAEALPDVRREDVRVHVAADAIVLQATTVATTSGGAVVRVPACVVAHVRDGRIVRFEQYADSAAAAALQAVFGGDS